MNEFGRNLLKELENLNLGSETQRLEFAKGLILLQNKYSDFFKDLPSDKKLITYYFAQGRPVSNSNFRTIIFKDYDKLPPDLELEVVDLFKSVFTV